MTVAYVTGLWDLSRHELDGQWQRPWSHYLETFDKLLKLDVPLYIFGDSTLKEFVFARRKESNTHFIEKTVEEFRKHPSQEAIQKIRIDPNWTQSVGWLGGSTQASLELQNPVVMTKFDMLAQASKMHAFEESHLFWVDGGIANTVNPPFIKVHENIAKYPDFFFIAFPQEANTEIHGFDAESLYKQAGSKTMVVSRGGFFGGTPDKIQEQFALQDDLRTETLSKGLMGTEESIFTILTQQKGIDQAVVEGNGLIYKFFLEEPVWRNAKKQAFATSDTSVGAETLIPERMDSEIAIYILTFQSPSQLKALLESFEAQDSSLLKHTVYLFQNTPHEDPCMSDYRILEEKYNLKVLGNGTNQGITRSRVEIAKHFHASKHEYQVFFEDDMLFSKGEGVCRSGFTKKVPQVLATMKEILDTEKLDFLKMNQSEFFGTHRDQWAWHNVPQTYRNKHWPGVTEKPPIQVTKIGKLENQNISYMVGEVFLCNWPILFNRRGNEVCYIETDFAWPQEQTLMSQAYQTMAAGRLRAGVLLASPTEHERFDFQKNERKEN